MTLFDQHGQGLAEYYRRLRDDDTGLAGEHRDMLDAQWHAAAPFLDSNFKSAFAHQTAQRFWELRLINALLFCGFELEPTAKNRPDIATRLPDGRRLWVEATAPTLGAEDNPDRPSKLRPNKLSRVPVGALLLRISQGFWDKAQRFRQYRASGVIAERDCTVIAVSSGTFFPYIEAPDMPRILSVLFPIGDERWFVDRATNEVIRTEHDYRGEVIRSSGQAVPMTAFDGPHFADISGVIYDWARPTGIGQQDFGRFYTVPNPEASSLLPPAYLPLGYECRVENENGDKTIVSIEHPRPANIIARY
jgi:hypothetical protein